MSVLKTIFTWWNGPGIGTRIFTARHGVEVGRDVQGNIYYSSGTGAAQRRWVIYNGEPEASRIPPEWHLWMHKTVNEPPSALPAPRVWERAATRGDYSAWTPDA